ncbi:transmembrane protein, putative [Bodo saltans]|uniref:Transmembrane protein, putative n=1 Tax=Bodo saltans TaxID=75058 RepID=A0A0S4JQI6_BODSA|nr:transmembrane protein, putative [Bodo saltans]|eukprot:CUG92605.1 transmembrane protein, putative [Bodo saltans]
MTSKVCDVVCKVTKPFVNVALKIENRAVRKTGALQGVVAEQVAVHDAAGTDAAQASTRRFVLEQQSLINYRVARFFHEARYVANGEYFKDYDYKQFIIDARMVTKMIVLYLLAYIFARGTFFPPIKPDSPYVESLKTKTNPNY